MQDVTLFMAFIAGIISFLSPCVLPVVPGYISFVSGVSVEEIGRRGEKRGVMVNSLLFITGFSIVFILLGVTASWMGLIFKPRMPILTKIAGLIIIFFGIFKLGLIRSIAFYREARFRVGVKDRKFRTLGALLVGGAFAFAWTPCIGPILGSILAYAGTLGKVNRGAILLLIYSMGLGVPFLAMAYGLNRFFGFFDWIKKYLHLIEVVSGIIMVILGLLVLTNKIRLIPGYLPLLNRFVL